ncbi:hypothetical protein [Dyella sp.]|jgi:hypothetical protein|uniref:hypothetical protein n=1 Tax=Dyella sp. TaxID=1869338 RepID=UPI002D77554F|nr:hypothetical protein [Dyella sp.]HET6433470.1 hypothetical protein [Dyella sp.]
MHEFLQTCLTFPTVVYSVLLAFCVVYWLLAMTGLFHVDAMDGLLLGDAHAAHGMPGHSDGVDSVATAGVLARLGLARVPIMIVLTALSFFCWLGTYFVHLALLGHLSQGLRVLAGIGTLLAVLVPGALLTSLLLRPLSRWLARLQFSANASIIGRVGTVISPQVDAQGGRAAFDDGGAGLILQVRSSAGETLARGERVVLLSHDAQAHTHAVISEAEFNQR